MKRLLIPILIILVIAVGCIIPTEPTKPANEPPLAFIDSVLPTKGRVSPGEPVVFKGHGIDPDGSVVVYSWRSSIDGEISTSASFETSSLSEGTHTVWFKVQDNSGDWSKEIPCHITVLPSGVVLPVIDMFEATPGIINAGTSSTLDWHVTGAATITIEPDIGNVSLTGSRVVAPAKATVYTLKATNEAGSVTSTAEITIAATQLHTVEVFSIAAEDGQVRRDKYVGQEPSVGDTVSNVAMQAFLSFDISMIPKGATVTYTSLDLSTGDIFGSPFTRLGRLHIYSHEYSKLRSSDFAIAILPGAIHAVSTPPTKPIVSHLLTEAIQKQIDADGARFQIRLQFNKYSFNNREADYMSFEEANPKLVIEYKR